MTDEALTPRTDEAIRFLKHWGGEPLLTAIEIDPVTSEKTGKIATRQFRAPVDWSAVADWIDGFQGKRNLYFSVNTPKGEVDKKTSRADIAAVVAFHVDSDLRIDEDRETGIPRILGQFKAYNPPPTDVIISGGGAQAFWRLSSPIPINGDITLVEDAKLWNIQLEGDLNGDKCHNIDRIMRLPGTINIPDAGKLKRGRVRTVASWHSTSEDTLDISLFRKAAPKANPGRNAEGFKGSGSYKPVPSNDGRLVAVDKKWLDLGINGAQLSSNYVDGGKVDRSRAVLAFATALMRAGVDDETVACIVMDPAWAIGACIRDKGSETKRQLTRLIVRAREMIEDDLDAPPVLSPHTWKHSAQQFMVRVPGWEHIVSYNEEFFRYEDGRYIAVEERTVRATCRAFLDSAKIVTLVEINGKQEKKLVPFNPASRHVTELCNALADLNHVDRECSPPPCWRDNDSTRPRASECVAFRNCIIHVPTRQRLEATPDFFTRNALQFDYNAAAPPPTLWLSTLRQYWPNADAMEPQLLQEMMGYFLLPITHLQKLFFILGPGRSGKGTITNVIKKLVGEENIASPTLGQLGKEFGLQPLIGKLLAVISEMGFGPTDDRYTATNMLKAISGEDTVDVNRKLTSHWKGRLLARFLGISNQLPDFADSSRALLTRIVALRMTISFEDHEDEGLGDRIGAEIASIFNWALEGYDRIMKTGRFTMPPSAGEIRSEMGRLASPARAFVEDMCDMDVDGWVSEDDIYASFAEYCERGGARPMTKQKLIEAVIAGFNQTSRSRRSSGNRGGEIRLRGIAGLRLLHPPPKPQNQSHGSSRKESATTGSTENVPF